jgi:hypothetical protein
MMEPWQSLKSGESWFRRFHPPSPHLPVLIINYIFLFLVLVLTLICIGIINDCNKVNKVESEVICLATKVGMKENKVCLFSQG